MCQREYLTPKDYEFNRADLMNTIEVDNSFFYSDHLMNMKGQMISTQTYEKFNRQGKSHTRSKSAEGRLVKDKVKDQLINSSQIFDQKGGLKFLKLNNGTPPKLESVKNSKASFDFYDKNENFEVDKKQWDELAFEINQETFVKK